MSVFDKYEFFPFPIVLLWEGHATNKIHALRVF